MTDLAKSPPPEQRSGPGFYEFVALIASLMAMTALTIDAMIPALPAIGEALGVTDNNDRQLVIGAMLIGFGGAQIIHGPLSDRFGRKPLLVGGLSLYAVFSVLAAVSQSFEVLLFARFMQGVAVAALRILAVSIVRDLFVARRMAQVMSMAMMVFMVVPVLAPLIGEIILRIADWRWIFWMFTGTAVAVGLWAWLRLNETLPPERRRPLTFERIGNGWRTTLTNRKSLGYMLASGMLSGALFGWINSIQQIVYDTFGRPNMLVAVFAITAGSMAVASLTNSRIVMRLGTRLVSHSALFIFIGFAIASTLVAYGGNANLWLFAWLVAGCTASFGLCGANFSAMAMEDMGEIAGTASSVQGAVTTVIGATLGGLVGQYFDGTAVPLSLGYLIFGCCALIIVLVTERGQLFREEEGESHPVTQPVGGG